MGRAERKLENLRQAVNNEALSPAELAQIRARAIRGGRRTFIATWALSSVAIAGAATVALLIFLWSGDHRSVHHGPFYVESGTDCLGRSTSSERVTVLAGCGEPVWLNLNDDRLAVFGESELVKKSDGVRLQRGRVRFHIRSRRVGIETFRVFVSHGMLEVVGTAFEVTQSEDGGQVTVFEGTVRFHREGSQKSTTITRGTSLEWPGEAAATGPDEGDSKTKYRRTRTPELLVDELLSRLLQLRSQRRYDEAIVLLERNLKRRDLKSLHKERLSYELGQLLSLDRRERHEVCRHWRRHIKAHPRGSTATEAREELRDCGSSNSLEAP